MQVTFRMILFCTVSFVLGCSQPSTQSQSSDKGSQAVVIASYAEPQGWSKLVEPEFISFDAAEKDTSIAVVSVPDAKSAEDAANKAWRTFDDNFNRTVRVNTPRDIAGGWSEMRRIEYVTSVAENTAVVAYTHQVDDQYQVVLLLGDQGTINKRAAAIGEMLDSFKVKGYTPEDLSAKSAKQLTDEHVRQLLSFIESSAESLNIPGVGIALSQDGKVLYQGGIGVANLETQQPVSEDTLFMVASNTKGMATLLLAKLVEMGKLRWQDKVIDHYPAFKLGDQKTTESVLIEHLVCACTGLPRRDLGWIFNNQPDTPAATVFDDLATTQPTSEFGDIFQYSNEMAAAAGYVAGHVLYPDMEVGAAFDKAMQEYIFTPLGMQDTTFSMSEALNKNHAHPYADDLNGNVSPIEQTQDRGFNHTVYAYRPAGGAWSSAADMLNYVQNELNEGIGADGERHFASEPLLARRKAYVTIGEDSTYGMGLATKIWAGIESISHGGSLAGYKSNWFAFPDANVGLVILTNSDEGGALLTPTARKLLELLYDGEPEADKNIAVAVERNLLYQKTQQREFTYPGNEEVLTNLSTSYQNDTLGELQVYEENGDIYLDPGVWRTQLGTKENADGTTSVVAVAPFVLGIEFLVDETDGRKGLTIQYAQDKYTFVGNQ